MKNISLIQKAKNYSLQMYRHLDMTYFSLPPHTHAMEIVSFAHKFEELLPEDEADIAISAAWAVDVADMMCTKQDELENALGKRIADVLLQAKGFHARKANSKTAAYVRLCRDLADLYHFYVHGDKEQYKYAKKKITERKNVEYIEDFKEMWDMLEDIEDFTLTVQECFPTFKTIDKENVKHLRLPNPISFSCYLELYRKGVIPKRELVKDTYYAGSCRNTSMAMWDGERFLYKRHKMGTTFTDVISCIEDDDGYDLFVPVEAVKNPPEGHKIDYIP